MVDADQIGPLDVAVLVFEDGALHTDLAPALLELHHSGVVHVLDDALVRRAADGTVSVEELVESEVAGAFAPLDSDHLDLLSEDDLAEVAATLAPGSAALVLVWENTWAARLAAAVRASGGEVRELLRIPHDIVLASLAALDEE